MSSYESWAVRKNPVGRIKQLGADVLMWATVLIPLVGWAIGIALTIRMEHGWVDVLTFAVMYLIAGFGVTLGYHRLLAHRAFKSFDAVRFVLMAAGSMGMQGPAIKWAATHRRHHQKSDREGDPHSPHLHGEGLGGFFHGLWHAHTGWLLKPDLVELERSVKDMSIDPVIRWVDRLYLLWVFLGAFVPFCVGYAFKGSIGGALVTVFWGFIVRIALMHHVTWSVNSICHLFGYRTYQATDHSRNNPVIALLSLGEGWHNNHHAFPTSARHGMKWYEFDASYEVLRLLSLVGVVWAVNVPAPRDREAKLETAAN